MRSRLISWLLVVVWMGLIFAVSAQPKTEIPAFGVWDLLVKKGAHMLAYALLGLLVLRATADWRSAILISVLYAISDEWHQTFVAGRNGQVADVVIDGVGAAVGLLFAGWVWPRLQFGATEVNG